MSTRTSDPELKAMATVANTLDGLDEPTRQRVLRWLADRYLPVPPAHEHAPMTAAEAAAFESGLLRDSVAAAMR